MGQTEAVDYLVLAGQAADDDADLYPNLQQGPSAGSSTVSVPLPTVPVGGVAATRTTVLEPADQPEPPSDGNLLWQGPLTFTTGTCVLSDWSMRAQQTLTLRPGTYDVQVTQDARGVLSVELRVC